MTDTNHGDPVRLAELHGRVFSRTLLQRPGMPDDAASDVVWVQGERYFCDVRCTAAGDATEGFAGVLTGFGGRPDVVEWVRTVDINPTSERDIGVMSRVDRLTVLERGIDDDYVEHWRIVAGPEARTASFTSEWTFVDPKIGVKGLVIRVGEYFGFAREGAAGVAPPEVSTGVVTATHWLVTRSTHSHRIGIHLDPIRDLGKQDEQGGAVP